MNSGDHKGRSPLFHFRIHPEGTATLRFDIEIPAEKVVVVPRKDVKLWDLHISVPDIPKGFDIRMPDISDYAFASRFHYECEATFVFEIPQKYVVGVREVEPENTQATN